MTTQLVTDPQFFEIANDLSKQKRRKFAEAVHTFNLCQLAAYKNILQNNSIALGRCDIELGRIREFYQKTKPPMKVNFLFLPTATFEEKEAVRR